MITKRRFLAGLTATVGTAKGGHAMGCRTLNPNWSFVADTVMGGVSEGRVTQTTLNGIDVARLTGKVSLDNNGGFIQMAFNPGSGRVLDASGYRGLAFDVRGNGQAYDISLRTTDLNRPWQSYRAGFTTTQDWQRVEVLFRDVTQNRTDRPFDPGKLRRIGILAVGRVFDVDVSVANLCLLG